MRIAIQGEAGSFSHEAALQMEPQATILPCSLSAEVFRLLREGGIDAAVIPIENSLAGSVLEHFDLLLENDVQIERESLLRIHHNLIAREGVPIAEIRRVFSHPVALAQCRRFFASHPQMEAAPFYDTAGSVKHVVESGSRDAAAIASSAAARVYGGVVLAAGIEDNPENYTRFFLVRPGRGAEPAADARKVSLAFIVENRPGTLVAALEVFARHGANLTKIESRPVPGRPWQYVFYADCQLGGPGDLPPILKDLGEPCSMVKVLGRYSQADLPGSGAPASA